MVSFDALKNKKEKICIVGLGYVGLPLAVELVRHFDVVGFDVKQRRIDELKQGIDRTKEVPPKKLSVAPIFYTSDPKDISSAKFIIVAVPTPVDKKNLPDLSLVEKATETVGKNMVKGSVVVYESTVYPGVTEDICLPILEKLSGLKAGPDFKIGYSPERINPGDKEHTIDKVIKVTSGMDDESAELITKVYGAIAPVFRAASIKVAEAAKVIENTQRDINIALMNELAIIFGKMDISVYDVLQVAGTKWNFLKFTPGLVGGHCIGVDPYYLTFKSQQLGYHPEVILSGRHTNDNMPIYIAEKVLSWAKEAGKDLKKSKVSFFGITFKENIPDSRNSKAWTICEELKKHGLEPTVFDPHAYADEVEHEYGLTLTKKENLGKADILIVAVAHDEFKEMLDKNLSDYAVSGALIVDIKRILDGEKIKKLGYHYKTL